MIRIEETLCDGCGICKEICPVDGVRVINGKAVANLKCMDCGTCISSCPPQAISANKVEAS
ncbi:MAG TPA: 4Fe-4S binding protein [Candidatus Omnitrophota bacterium]|nr:4Fe-4S binding protein [Candidatus Omnitrophota bacterium]